MAVCTERGGGGTKFFGCEGGGVGGNVSRGLFLFFFIYGFDFVYFCIDFLFLFMFNLWARG